MVKQAASTKQTEPGEPKEVIFSTTRHIVIQLVTDMLGTVPYDKEVYDTFIQSKKPPELAGEDETATVEQMEKSGWTGFHKDEHGLFIYGYMVKGFFKQAGNVMKDMLGIKALRSKLDDFLFIEPRRIYLGMAEAHGTLERPIRIMTMQGPRVALVRSDYIKAGLQISFDVILMKHEKITWDTIQKLLEYGKRSGLGQWRNGAYGQFEVVSFSE